MKWVESKGGAEEKIQLREQEVEREREREERNIFLFKQFLISLSLSF